MAVTLDRVRDIVLDCLRRGEAPSQRAVRKALGGGSPNEIGPLVREVMFELAGRPSTTSTLPASLTQATEALWQLALAQASQSFDAERAQAQMAVLSWKTQADHFSAQAETRAAELASAAARIQQLSAEETSLEADLQRSRQQHRAAEEALQVELKALTARTQLERRERNELAAALERESLQRASAETALKTQQAQLDERAIALAEARGAMGQAQLQMNELSGALEREHARAQQLLIEAAQHGVQQKLLREQLTASVQQLTLLQAELATTVASHQALAQTLDAIAALAQPLPSKANQPERCRIDGVSAQIALARLLSTHLAR